MSLDADFGKTAADYAKYRAGFPDRLFDRLFAAGIVRRGDTVLDLGTGTGTLGRGLAVRGCGVTGLDPAQSMLDEARRIDAEAGVATIYVKGRAEHLPFDDAAFEVVCAGQCWHWFDRARAAEQARRVLKSDGRLVIAHFDWVPLPGNVADATEHLIMRHNPQWKMNGGTGLHPRSLADVALAGFTDLETFSFDLGVPYSHDAWRGRIRASAGIAASLPPEKVAQFDDELARLLDREYPENPLTVLHRVWVLTAFKGTRPHNPKGA